MAKCDARSPLVRAGTTQSGRDIAELDPDYFRIDERTVPDLVLCARALSREIRYYGPDNRPDGDWEPFFATDITATLAALARLPVAAFRSAFADVEEFLKDEPGRLEPQLRSHFNLIFHLPVALFAELARAHRGLPRDHKLHEILSRLVAEDLVGPLTALLRYYKGAIGAAMPLGDPEPALAAGDYGGGAPGDPRPRLSDTVSAALFVPEVLTQRPIGGPAVEALGAADWAAFAAAVAGDPIPYQQAVGPNLLYEQIYDALTFNLLSTELERVFQGIERATREADRALDRSLAEVNNHTPHYGLFLAFLDMLAVARRDLNRMTGRHLDLYYRRVLRMAPRAPVPDSVHVLFEPAKGISARLVPQGTSLRAGKDATGKDVVYRVADDIVVNRGRVAELRAIRVNSVNAGGELHQTVFASLVANTADGVGAPLPEGQPAWPPFGPMPYPPSAVEPQAPFGRIGFAFADRRLFLREGMRTVHIGFELDAPLPPGLLAATMRVRLTTPDGWHEVSGEMVAPFFFPNLLYTGFSLDGDQPPVVPFDPAIHAEDNGSGYEAGLPVAELTFAFAEPADATARAFARLRAVRIEKVYLYIAASGLRSLSLLTSDGVDDPSRPFPAFGARPKANSALIVGSAEIFAKKLHSLRFRVTWEETYSASTYFRKTNATGYAGPVSYLARGTWQTTPDQLDPKFNSASPTLGMPGEALIDGTAEMSLRDPAYGPGARTGFMRLQLSADFGHDAYSGVLTRAMIAIANGTKLTSNSYNIDSDGMPRLPYTPVIREITAEYETTGDPPAQFYHVAPFGQALRASEGESLLPPLDYEGALFVGVADFAGPARLSLLVQVANGSGDPLLEVPLLAFDFMAGNEWKRLTEQDVDDKTDNFAASAALGFALPKEADTGHGLMPDGLHWVRISAPANAAAVNSLIAVEAQAARAVFADNANDPQFLATPLAPGTIAKPVVPDPKIKKLHQPYASFGGSPQESAASFRRRAAERLRHKDRASTIWDYERLALEAAPELYRVKCLNHTEIVREGGKIVADNELSPGGVVVVTVPWTTGRPHLDPLRPYTDQATLKKVRDVLTPRLSPFVRLEVANPKFEEVQVRFKVAFLDGIDDTAFYLGELEKAVIGHLAPWSVGRGADITFGGKLRKSTIIDFVEELPYVDFLEDFELYHRPDPANPVWTPIDQETIEATTARSILVPAASHQIEELV
jgi:hypothetical protein